MQLAYPQNDTRAETLRYLGAGGWQPDAASQVLLQKAEDALRAAATPRGVWKQLPLTALPLQNAGNDIARHLRGCDAMVLMAVTLGSGADTLMRRLELTDIALAAVVDAMASAVMEELCNALEAEIRTSVQAQGHYLTGRFFPRLWGLPADFAAAVCHCAGYRARPWHGGYAGKSADPAQKRNSHPWRGGPPGNGGPRRVRALPAARKVRIQKEGNHL